MKKDQDYTFSPKGKVSELKEFTPNAHAMYKALKELLEWTYKINTGDDGDQIQQRAESILNKANPKQ